MGYEEEFEEGSSTTGSYVCHIVIAAPKLTMSPGGPPPPFVAPAPREHGTPQEGLLGAPLLLPQTQTQTPAPGPVVSPVLARIWASVLRGLGAAVSAPGMTVAFVLWPRNSRDAPGY